MKRIALTTMTAILLLCMLTSCIVIRRHKRYKIPSDTVASVEIYDLRECYQRNFGGFLEEEHPVYEIPQEDQEAFLEDLSKIRFTDVIVITVAAVDPSFYYGDWTARINYDDGTYELISCGGYGETYDQSGEVIDSHHYGCDADAWEEFIGKYVPARYMQAFDVDECIEILKAEGLTEGMCYVTEEECERATSLANSEIKFMGGDFTVEILESYSLIEAGDYSRSCTFMTFATEEQAANFAELEIEYFEKIENTNNWRIARGGCVVVLTNLDVVMDVIGLKFR